MSEYRLYTFVNNVYMSPIQWGIQTAHVVSSIMAKPQYRNRQDLFHDWANDSPTIIVCKGGPLIQLEAIASEIERLGTHFDMPWASFYEDQASLGGILTCTGILVPEVIFNAKKETMAYNFDETIGVDAYDHEKNDLIQLICMASLA